MISVKIGYYLGSPAEKNKFSMGGRPEGTMEIYPDRLEVFKKSTGVKLAFGVIGSAIEGKGKPEITITRNMVSSFEKRLDNNGKYNKCILFLSDSRCFDFFIRGFNLDEVRQAIDEFLDGQAGSSSAGDAKQPAAEDSKFRFCTECGHKLEGTYKFCAYCGAKLYEDPGKDQTRDRTRNESEPRSEEDKIAAIVRQADYYHEAGEYEQEIKYLESVTQQFPSNIGLKMKLGRAYRFIDDYIHAIEIYDHIILSNTEEPVTYNNMGTVCIVNNFYGAGLPFMEKAMNLVKSKPESATPEIRGMIYAGYALCIGKCGYLDTALDYIKKAEKEGYQKDGIDYVKRSLGLID